MSFTAIIGPMKSGKSLELIARLAPYQYTDLHILFVQSAKHVRDSGVQSRAGVQADAKHVSTLREIGDDFDIIAIDEFHMFDDPGDIHTLSAWLQSGKSVYVAGLDVDYSGTLTKPFAQVLAQKPTEIVCKYAVCEVCRQFNAQFTQIIKDGKPIVSGLPSVVPEDGTYGYEPRCRNCFVRA